MIFGEHAADAQVRQVVQHRRRQRDVEAGGVGHALAQLPLQGFEAIVGWVQALQRGLYTFQCQILEMMLGGYNQSEISRHLGVTRHTVRRTVDLIQRQLRSRSAEEGK